MKVVGIKRADCMKDYRISHDGHEFLAEREGDSFACEGQRGTLKEIKKMISDGVIKEADDDEWDDEVVYEPTSIWDCVHPCALLAMTQECVASDRLTSLLEKEDSVLDPSDAGPLAKAILESEVLVPSDLVTKTLDAWGWCDADGIDVQRVNRELERFNQKDAS